MILVLPFECIDPKVGTKPVLAFNNQPSGRFQQRYTSVISTLLGQKGLGAL
jgi:hypothetical protein